MKNKEKLIKFLELQSNKLNSMYKYNKDQKFFTVKDKKRIEKWTEKKATEIWEKIKWNIKHEKYLGLLSFVSPFCIYFEEDCSKCTYAKDHKETCLERGSLCERLCEDIFHIKNKSHTTFLNKEFYEEVLKEISKN